MNMGDSFLNETVPIHRSGAHKDDILRSVDENVNHKIAAGLKKATSMLYNRLQEDMQEKINLLFSDQIEYILNLRIKEIFEQEYRTKLTELAK